MSDFLFHWLHHTHNFPTGFTLFGVPLFAVNRGAKFLLFVAALVILIDIRGPAPIEQSFGNIHDRLLQVIERYDAGRKRISQELNRLLRLFMALFRSLVRKETVPPPVSPEDRGTTSQVMGIVLLTLFAVAAFLNAIFVPVFVSTWDASFLFKAFYGLVLFVFSCAFWLFNILLFFFGITGVLWLVNASILRPLDAVVMALAKLVLHHVHDKGAAHSWRMASFYLLILGFVLDMATS